MNQPIILHRSLIGLVAILLGGLLFGAGILALAYWYGETNQGDAFIPPLLCLLALIVLFVSLLWALVYNWHTMTLTDTGITIKSWHGLLFSSTTSCDYDEIQELNVRRGGLAAMGLGYGTLVIQTASARPDLRFDYLPDPERWKAWIDEKS
ncbi:PH domain-containing protein [Rhodococcus sp. NPDC004095]